MKASSYDSLTGYGNRKPDAAWYYPNPKPAAGEIKEYVAFQGRSDDSVRVAE